MDDPFAGHGGRLCVARALHPDAPQPWIDLSTGINPKPYPAPRASAVARARLPEPAELQALKEIAARAFGVEDPERIVATAGSEAALRMMPYVLGAHEAVVVGPTYSSHADAWWKAGSRVDEVDHSSSLLMPHNPQTALHSHVRPFPCDERGKDRMGALPGTPHPNPPPLRKGGDQACKVLTVVNPNNPDGCVLSRDRLLALHDELAAHDGYLVVDEAFAETDPTHSIAAFAGSAQYPRLLALRSFGKFYGLAGVRLGFVISAPDLAQRFRSLYGDWPVTADAIAAGLAAYADSAWAERMRARLQQAARRLDALLVRSGFTVVGGTSLFRLVRSDTARATFDRLLHAGILVRPFDHDPTLLRFGLPYGAAAWRRLGMALR